MDALAAADPNPGWRPFQRLNRAEYAREVKYLLGLDVDVTAFLPADTISDGFDNVADVQTFSPTLMEGYLRAASRIAMLAVGDPDSTATQATFKLPKTASQMERVDGAPPGTRGGISVEHIFPADGEYVFSMDFFAEPLGFLFGNTSAGRANRSLGRRRPSRGVQPRPEDERGEDRPHPQDRAAQRQGRTASRDRRVYPALRRLDQRPDRADRSHDGRHRDRHRLWHHDAAAPAQPERGRPAQGDRRVRHAQPPRGVYVPADVARDEDVCATQIVRNLATQAFRRPVADKDLARLMSFYARGRKEKNFEFGVTKALEAILASPQFLLRVEEILPSASRAATSKARGVSPGRLRTGIAAVVLPVGHRP